MQSKPRWREGNLVRWREGFLEPQGGWQRRQKDNIDLTVTGVARAAFIWRDNNGVAWLAIGTHSKLYVFANGLDKSDITPAGYVVGTPDASISDGYGRGDYGEGDYGMPAMVDLGNATIAPATVWTLDNWGQNLLAQANTDGKIYEWSPATAGTLPLPVSGAPVNAESFVVTNERILMVFGGEGSPRLVKWSNQENNTDWTPTPLNQAGQIELHTNGMLVTGRAIPDGVLIWTTEDLWLARYLGQPFIYGFNALAGKCSLASGQAIGLVDSRVVWMGAQGFWIYDGYLQPLPSEVGDDVFSHLNRGQMSKIWCLTNHDMHEVVWFYPSDASNEIDSYVTWNWKENYWITGKLERTCGVSAGIIPNPILCNAAGFIYNHGVGFQYDGLHPFVESWPLELGNGERTMMVQKLIPDELALGDVNVSFRTRQWPTGPEIEHGPFTLKNPTNLRLANKQVAIKFTGVNPVFWRIGKMRLEVRPQGQR